MTFIKARNHCWALWINRHNIIEELLVPSAVKTVLSISQNGISSITLDKQLDNHLNKDIINASISLFSFHGCFPITIETNNSRRSLKSFATYFQMNKEEISPCFRCRSDVSYHNRNKAFFSLSITIWENKVGWCSNTLATLANIFSLVMDKLQLRGRNLGRVFNLRSGYWLCACEAH